MSRPLRVLLVEDDQNDARLIVHELRRAGFEPVSERVETEPEFLARLDPALDLILADYHLPQFDALRTVRLVQERGLDVPVIVVTGALPDEAAVECLKQGAANCLLKDRLARLGQAVAHALEQRQARDDRRRAEAALCEREARKTAILETALDGIITIDHQGQVGGEGRSR
jgi:CheY-like chemotaxis protein